MKALPPARVRLSASRVRTLLAPLTLLNFSEPKSCPLGAKTFCTLRSRRHCQPISTKYCRQKLRIPTQRQRHPGPDFANELLVGPLPT
ncbi:hypothetical protein QO002_005963 [Pararhizobium capsulatum DSM 1112]|uniref:Secreted protein n=1 Tax=Pararhizobium capsulatum DSM 1112 TaxID=1121113 RepID=A0ABU0BZR6_9HYPH|nr:hypothetical protein [Pararhizobium capsulatum DSM 1112]